MGPTDSSAKTRADVRADTVHRQPGRDRRTNRQSAAGLSTTVGLPNTHLTDVNAGCASFQVSPDPETPAFTAPSHGPAADPPPGPAGGRRRPTAPSQTSSTPSPPPELQRLTEHFAEVDKEVLREGAPVKWVAVDAELAQRREAIIEDGSVRAKDPALAEAYDAYAAEWGGDAPTLSELAGHIPGRIELFLG